MTTDPVQQQVAEVLRPALTRHHAEAAAQALADAGLLPTGRTEWAWVTPSGERIAPVTKEMAHRAVEEQGGTVQTRTVYTAPDPTPWRDA